MSAVPILAIGESLTQKGLWPLGRGDRRVLWPPWQIYDHSAVKCWFSPSVTLVSGHTGGPELQLKQVVWLSAGCCTIENSGFTHILHQKWFFFSGQSLSPSLSTKSCRTLTSCQPQVSEEAEAISKDTSDPEISICKGGSEISAEKNQVALESVSI